jgi:hypothetical protein
MSRGLNLYIDSIALTYLLGTQRIRVMCKVVQSGMRFFDSIKDTIEIPGDEVSSKLQLRDTVGGW